MADKKNSNPLEPEELSAEDYAIIAAGLTALGDFFAFLSLMKAKEIAKQTGGTTDVIPALFIRSRNKKPTRRSR